MKISELLMKILNMHEISLKLSKGQDYLGSNMPNLEAVIKHIFASKLSLSLKSVNIEYYTNHENYTDRPTFDYREYIQSMVSSDCSVSINPNGYFHIETYFKFNV